MKLPKVKIKVSITKGDKYVITTPESVVSMLREIFNADTFNWTEEVVLVCLNRANVVIGVCKVSSGGFSGTVCDPKVIMTIALQCAASSIILAHNHPSGNTTPSAGDIDVTKKVSGACKLFDMNLLDHIILTDDSYVALSELGHI